MVATALAFAALSAAPAYSAALNWTVQVNPYSTAGNGDYPGITGQTFFFQTLAPSPTSEATVPTGFDSISFGRYINEPWSADPNATVSPNFTITVSPTGTGITGTPTLTFYGVITNPSGTEYNVTFYTDKNGSTYSTPADQMSGGYVFEDVGAYSFGIVQSLSASSTGKNFNLTGFVAPTVTPEPMSLGLTGLALCGLLGFGLRRKRAAVQA